MASEKNIAGTPKLGDEKVFEGKKFEERIIIRQKMIKNYGTSLANADEEKQTKHVSPNIAEQSSQKNSESTFDQRVQKRRIAYELLKNPNVPTSLKKDLEANFEEYLQDPNIIFSPDGKIHYISSSQDKKRIVYIPTTGADYELKQRDSFDGSFGASLDRARRMALSAQFPVVILPWDESRQTFELEYLDKQEQAKDLMQSNDFQTVGVSHAYFSCLGTQRAAEIEVLPHKLIYQS